MFRAANFIGAARVEERALAIATGKQLLIPAISTVTSAARPMATAVAASTAVGGGSGRRQREAPVGVSQYPVAHIVAVYN